MNKPAAAAMTIPDAQFAAFLQLLKVIEGRKRRVRAILKVDGKRVGELTIRSQCLEPGVMVNGSVFADKKLAHDASWLANVVSKVSSTKLTSAEASRRLIRSTRKREVAEQELMALTSRALLRLAELLGDGELTVEYTKSGPKRGPVYMFQSLELLAGACAEFMPMEPAFDVAESLGQYADALWHFRRVEVMPGYSLTPLVGSQGETTVREALDVLAEAEGLFDLAEQLRIEGSDAPVSAHYLRDDFGIAWIANRDEIAVARLLPERSVLVLGPSRSLTSKAN